MLQWRAGIGLVYAEVELQSNQANFLMANNNNKLVKLDGCLCWLVLALNRATNQRQTDMVLHTLSHTHATWPNPITTVAKIS